MRIESILRRLHPLPGFVYSGAKFVEGPTGPFIHIEIRARKGSHARCSGCGVKRPGYDTLSTRMFQFVPLWGLTVWLLYAMRRVDCRRCGVRVEMVPWATGKLQSTHALAWFLASWAKVLSWKETARRFRVSWDTVFRCVQYAVNWGLANRRLDGIRSIGVDELAAKKGQNYLTVVYQIDHGCKRLLWIGRDRTAATFSKFFDWLGEERSKAIEFVASDMWKAFLGVVARRANAAIHVLDRFHVAKLFGEAIDEVRRKEVRELREQGDPVTLTKTRWLFLKRRHRLSDRQEGRLAMLLRLNLTTVRSYLLREDFHSFWSYISPGWAGRFLDRWIDDALRSRIAPMTRLARTLRQHREHLLNWFRARGAFAMGAVEGFNNKARVTTRMAYGFKSYEHAEVALFHRLGDLPEPQWLAHKFA